MSISIRDVILVAAIAFGIWVTFDDYDKPEWVLEVESASEARSSISEQPVPKPEVLAAPIAE